jgi:hypothetical protein
VGRASDQIGPDFPAQSTLAAVSEVVVPTGWSADGNWFWDGWQWNDAVSPDGKWRFDGKDWKHFKGKRSPLPTEPLHPQPPPLPPQPTAVEMPSWVATSEIDRLENERQERAILAAAPVLPPPPELDWRRSGHYIKHSKMAGRHPDWPERVTSVAIYVSLLLFCPVGALVYVWISGWRFTTKLILTVVSVGVPIFIFLVLVNSGLTLTVLH